MRDTKSLFIPILIFLLSFLLRMSLMSKGPYNIDCLNLALQSEHTLSTGQLGHMLGTGYPLTVILGAVFIFVLRLLNITDIVFAVNFMSVLFSSLAVGSFYFLAKKLFDRSTAFFSSIMFALCPIFLGISIYGKSQPINMFVLISGIYFLACYKKERITRYLILGGLFLGCAGANRAHEMVLMFLPISYFLMSDLPQSRMEGISKWRVFFTLWIFVALVTFLLHLPYFIQKDSATYYQQISDWFDMGLNNKFILSLSPRIFIGAGYLLQSLTWGGIIVFLSGMILLLRRDPYKFWFFFLWILFPYVFYSNSTMSVTPRYFVIILPPVLLAQGYMFSCLANKNRVLKFMVAGLFLVMINVLWLRVYPPLKIRHQNAYVPEYARWLTEKTEPHARIISSDESMFIKYYGNRKPLSRPLRQNRITKYELDQYKKNLDGLLDDQIPVYIHSVSLFSYDRGGYFAEFMKKNYNMVWVGVQQYEDWHQGEMVSAVFPNHLYEIRKK